jgi:hypothetical protein
MFYHILDMASNVVLYMLVGRSQRVLTPKIGKGRLGSGRLVRPGLRGGLTGCPVAGLAQRGQAV